MMHRYIATDPKISAVAASKLTPEHVCARKQTKIFKILHGYAALDQDCSAHFYRA